MSAPSTVQWLRTAVHRIAVGSGRRATYLTAWTVHRARRIWRRATGWLGEGEGLGWLLRLAVLFLVAAIVRKIATALAGGIYHRVEDGGAPWLLWGAAACWIVSAYRAGAEGWKPKRPAVPDAPPGDEAESKPDKKAKEGTEQALAKPPEKQSAPPVSPVELVAAVRDVGTPHAQLKPVAEHLRTTTDAVRAAAAGIGWPVKDVRMEGRSSSAGLRWDDCPSPGQAYPSSGVVGAPTCTDVADDNDDDRPGEGRGEGLRVVKTDSGQTVFDLSESHRYNRVAGE